MNKTIDNTEEKTTADQEEQQESNKQESKENEQQEQYQKGTCKICGLPSDVYEVCRQCQIRINNGDIIKCPKCGTYHLKGIQCICNNTGQNSKQTSKVNVEVNNNEAEDESAFSKGFGGTMGVGCGCVAFAAIILVVVALVAGGSIGAFFDLFK